MKTTALSPPKLTEAKTPVPLFKTLLSKKSVYFFLSLFTAGLAVLIARCTVLTYCSPFALALACAVPAELMPAAVIGATVGYLFGGFESVPVRYLIALIMAVILKRIFPEKTASHPLFAGITALVCCASTGFVTALILDEVETTLLPYVGESFIAAASAVFWAAGSRFLMRLKSSQRLGESETACLLVSVFLIILGLSYIHIGTFSLAKILACLTVLISAYYGKTGAGSLAGIGAGAALGFGSENAFTFAGLSLGGMLAGLGASHSKLLSVIALEAGLAMPVLFGLGDTPDFTPFLEAGIAALLFLLLPKRFLNKYRFRAAIRNTGGNEALSSYTVSRLRFASNALEEVGTSVHAIGNKTKALSPNKKTAVYLNTMHKTCEKCGLKYYCWEREKDYTVSIFKKIESMLENETELTPENLPGSFGNVCIRNKVLIKNFTLEHRTYLANKLASEKSEAMREVMSVQFDALSQLLYDLSEDIAFKQFPESELTRALKDLLDEHTIEYLSADVSTDIHFRNSVILKVPYRQPLLEETAFLKELGDLCSKTLVAPQIDESDSSVKLSYFEKVCLRCEIGFAQLSAENNAYCGDSYESIKDFSGNFGVVLADGMGKGLGANINANLSSGIVKKLINAGFSPAAAIKICNAALMVKDDDESFSSLDLLTVDLFTGEADFFKAGATCSFVKKRNRIRRVELSSMPVGILENADFAHCSMTVEVGDIILLLSDGVTQGDNDWIHETMLSPDYNTPAELAELICKSASKKQFGVHEDDITAIAVFVCREE